ncbi:MAG: hypothetical protein KDK08_07250 [Rhizobiaceae bacterium]|nr:hypothetical protein [Rhizobiaceae bacterium]MCC0043909.1 hypothetical protein [Brucellaceae bacterium]
MLDGESHAREPDTRDTSSLSSGAATPLLSKAANDVIAALGYIPSVPEVRPLALEHHKRGLLSSAAEDIPLAEAMGRAFEDGNGAEAYAALLELRRRGPALDRILDLVEQLFGAGRVVEFRALSATGRGASSHNWETGSDRKIVLDFLREHDGLRNLYFGVNPRAPGLRDTARPGSEADVICRQFVLFDHDNKDAKDGE